MLFSMKALRGYRDFQQQKSKGKSLKLNYYAPPPLLTRTYMATTVPSLVSIKNMVDKDIQWTTIEKKASRNKRIRLFTCTTCTWCSLFTKKGNFPVADPGISKRGARSRRGRIFRSGVWGLF